MHFVLKSMAAALIAGATISSSGLWAQQAPAETGSYTPMVGQAGKDVVWVPTAQALVDRMLDMAGVKPTDRLVDLGSGDGRTVITAAKRGLTARGIEFNAEMVTLARRAAEAEGVTARATFENADIFLSDFSEATVVTLFLLPHLNVRLRPILLNMPPGTRVVSNTFPMEDWQPDERAHVSGNGCSTYCTALKWVVPAKVAGTWKIGDKELVITQTFQMLSGSLRDGSGSTPISDARMDGARIRFTVAGKQYAGEVASDQMRGTVDGKESWDASRRSL